MNVVIAFAKIENARNIKSILQKGGYRVDAVCTSGNQALQNANTLDGGILICGYRLPDMFCTQMKEYLPENFQMLLVGSQANMAERDILDVVCLSMPLKVHELLQTVEMMAYACEKRKKRQRMERRPRTEAEKQILNDAKSLLMERNQMTEQEAHRYLQKSSMDSGTGMLETAQMVLRLMDL